MTASHIKLWKLLLDRRLKRVDIKELVGISSGILAKFGRDEYLSIVSMEKVCKVCNVNIGDVMEFTENLENDLP